jgi:hypothetical protein
MYFRDPSGHDLEVITTPYGKDNANLGRRHTKTTDRGPLNNKRQERTT